MKPTSALGRRRKESIEKRGGKKSQLKEARMQGSKLYVGNLGLSVTNQDLQDLFSQHGEVREVNIIQGKGFGFVEMSNPAEAEAAKEALDGSDCKGLTLKVDEARPPRKREGGGRPPGRGRRGGRPPGRGQGRNSRRY